MSAALVVVVYLVAVRTAWGQTLDSAVVRGRRVLSPRDVHVATRFHRSLDVAALSVVGTAVVAVALVRRRHRLAMGIIAIVVGSVATTEGLKHTLARPQFTVHDALKGAATYPSGHTTVAMALGVAAMLALPLRWRAAVATTAALFAAAIACSLIATASHRPSDTIGAVFVVTAWTAGVAVWLLPPTATRPTRPALSHFGAWIGLGGIALVTAGAVAAVFAAFALHFGGVRTVELGRTFVGASSATSGTVLVCVAALLLALHGVDVGRPSARAPRRT